MSNITKTSISSKKEKELAELEKKIRNVNADLQKLKSKYDKLIADIDNFRQEAYKENPLELLMQLKKIKEELTDVWKKMNKTKGIEPKAKFIVKEQYDFIVEELAFFLDSFKKEIEINEKTQKENQHFNSENFKDKDPLKEILKASIPQVDENERKAIRKLFVKIANHLHPDKAKDKSQEEYLHQLMQKANEAYKRNDIATLLEMEEKFVKSNEPYEMPSENNALFSLIDEKILMKKQELEMLLSQKKRLKTEINNINQSPIGQFIKDFAKTNNHETTELKNSLCLLRDVSIIIQSAIEDLIIYKSLNEEIKEKLEKVNQKFEEERIKQEETYEDLSELIIKEILNFSDSNKKKKTVRNQEERSYTKNDSYKTSKKKKK
ncbi:MAG: hypothetical protein OHK0038_27580 [Flammeovirgaceae bacterium]